MINNYKQKIRTALAAICLFASFSSVMAQVSAYSFSSSSGTYTPITGGTNFPSTSSLSLDDDLYTAQPIGFTFNYNGTNYTDFGVNANGWISLGASAPVSSSSALSSGTTNNVISAFNTDLLGRLNVTANRTTGSNQITVTAGNSAAFEIGDVVGGTGIPAGSTITNIAGSVITISANATSTGTGFNFRVWKAATGIRYETVGTAPNRKLIVQWSYFCRFSTTGGSNNDNLNFQIILNETSNVIETKYNIPNASTFATYPTAQIGLRGAANTDFNNRTTTTDWSATTAGTLNSSTVLLSATIFPSVGLTYTFTPPTPCSGTPAAGTTAGPLVACSGVNFNLSLSGVTPGVTGLTYQWQSSPDGITYTDISGANAATYTANQTAPTYYQCLITCTNGGGAATSTPIQVNMSSFINCYCSSGLTTTGGLSDAVTNVVITNSLLNTLTQASSGAAPWYTSYNNTPLDLVLGSSNTVAITFGTDGTQHSAVWADWNQNGVFEASENVALSTASSGASSTVTYTFSVPTTASLGNTRIRVRGGSDGAYTAGGACSGTGYGETEDYLINITCPTLVAPAVTGGAACAGNTVNLSATATFSGSTLTWYNAAVAGTVVNTGATFTTPILVANTSYWVSETITGCTESPLAEVIATISPVDAVLGAVNVTCNGLGNGSFTVDNIICGQTPFTFSVNGGTFGAIPTNLVPGTYSVVIEDANTLQSAPISIVITEPNYTINNPVGVNASTCLNETSVIISATSTLTTNSTGTQVVTFDLTAQPTELGGNSSFPAIATNQNIISTAMVNALPANATVTSVTFTLPGLTPQGGSYGNDVGFGFTGAVNANYAAGTGAPASATAFNYTRTIPVGSININGGVVNLNYYDLYNDVTAGAECIFPIGTAVGTLTINYSFPNPANITWWDAATGGTQIGTGNTLESVGTSVLANTSTAGVFNFYAEGETAGCSSPSRTLVTTTVNGLPTVTVTSDDTDNTVCEDAMITLTGAGAATYAYTGAATNASPFVIAATETFTITGTDGNGCVDTDVITINVTPAPTVTAVSDVTNNEICGSGDVTLTSGGTAVSYTWNNGVVEGVAFNTSASNIYTVTGVDAIGCVNTASVAITVFTLPTVTATSDVANNQLCNSGDVILTAGGTATSYVWDNSVVNGVVFNTSATNTYNVIGTDVNGCENTASITITVNPLPTVTVTSNDTDNTVCENTMITLTGAGAVSYAYTGTVTDATPFNIVSTETYTITGTDANGCVDTDVITINVTAAPTVTAVSDVTNNEICGSGDVILTSGGTAVSYTWDNSVVEGVAFNTSATNTYTVTGVDAIGCENTASVTITVFDLPTVTATSDVANNQLCNSGDVILTAGGNATSYAWDNSVVDGVAFNTSATNTYTVTGTDANGCENTASITITVNPLPTVTVTSDDADNTVCENAMITLSGAGAVTYTYTGAVTDATPFAIAATETFTVTGTDANGCVNTSNITITVNSLPTVSATSNDANNAICTGSSVIVTGVGASTYTFTGGISNGVSFSPTATNTYTVTGTDANGCVNTGTITITVNQLPVVDIAPYTEAVCDVVTNYSLTNVSPLAGVFSGANVTGTTFNPNAAGVGVHPITYTVTDINGCVGSDVENITVGDCSGIEENSSIAVSVYPNPTNGEFTLAIKNANFSNITINIVDIHGKIVYNEMNVTIAQDIIKQINVSDLARGIYFVKLNNGSDISTQKLIIQ